MPELANVEATEKPNDVLLVRGQIGTERVRVGTEDDGETPVFEDRPVVIEARGWISATTNHFDPDDYLPDGHRKPLPPTGGAPPGKEADYATPRSMTDAERAAYAERLLREQNPDRFEGA